MSWRFRKSTKFKIDVIPHLLSKNLPSGLGVCQKIAFSSWESLWRRCGWAVWRKKWSPPNISILKETLIGATVAAIRQTGDPSRWSMECEFFKRILYLKFLIRSQAVVICIGGTAGRRRTRSLQHHPPEFGQVSISKANLHEPRKSLSLPLWSPNYASLSRI